MLRTVEAHDTDKIPNLYNKAWYEDARIRGEGLARGLFNLGLTPMDVNQALAFFDLTRPEVDGVFDYAAADWMFELLASAQDVILKSPKANESILEGKTDYRKLAPRARYLPPTK